MKKFLFAGGLSLLLSPGLVAAAEITVTMAGMKYAPAQISASVGDAIRFVNDGDADHNVFVPTAQFATDLGKQQPGQEAVMTIGKAGTFEVECVFHSHMHAVVEVK